MRFHWLLGLVVGIALGFGGGFVTATQISHTGKQDGGRQELLRQFVSARAGIESGLSVGDLRKSDTQVRAALDLTSNSLDEHQRAAAVAALHALDQTIAAWDETLTRCHAGGEGYVGLGEGYETASQSWNPDCTNKELNLIYEDMGVLGALIKWTENPALTLAPKRGTLLLPLFGVSLDRIQTAVDSLR